MNIKNKSVDVILLEAKRLYDLGLGVHWLRPNSKAPVKRGWSGYTRDDWESLEGSYRQGYGLGICLGSPSKLENGFLVVVDLDIRSSVSRYYAEAVAVLDKVFPGIRSSAPMVETGRGEGSAHFYFMTREIRPSANLGRSSERVKVYSPSSVISNEQDKFVELGKLTRDELKKGYRMKSAWEVDFMSAGKQVVAPPTRHPDTQRRYRWAKGRGL